MTNEGLGSHGATWILEVLSSGNRFFNSPLTKNI